MGCYFRDLEPVFKEAKVEVTPENRKNIDMAIHQAIGNPSANHDATRDAVRERLRGGDEKRKAFVEELLKAIRS